MLARTIAWVCGCVMVMPVSFAEEKPNVVVILAGEEIRSAPEATAHEVLDYTFLPQARIDSSEVAWRAYRGDCRISPSRAAVLIAILYGLPPLQMGVVTDKDWRRRPVAGHSLLEIYRKAGYQIERYGDGWSQKTLNQPWRTSKPTKDAMQEIRDAFSKNVISKKPWIAVFQQGGVIQDEALARLMRDYLIPGSGHSTRPTLVLILCPKSSGKEVVASYHYPANLYLYYYGDGDGFNRHIEPFRAAKTDWELHTGFLDLIEKKERPIAPFRFFHKANWPASESPDKHRHRGSLVVGNGYALVDGLNLYPATKTLEPDYTKPLDLAENQKMHREMLMAHSNWWQKAREALYDPRSFSVGVAEKKVTRLTAMDWRPSKIIHADESVPSSKPVVFQKELITMLKGLQDDTYRQAFPPYSGSWSVDVTRAGRYKITASLLPKDVTKPEEKKLAKLRGGRAFIRLGRNEVQLNLIKGASAVSVHLDADAGVTDLECWFTGQLALERELGAFFVEIERVGDQKFDLKAK